MEALKLQEEYGVGRLSFDQAKVLGEHFKMHYPAHTWYDEFGTNAIMLTYLCPSVRGGMITESMVIYLTTLWQQRYYPWKSKTPADVEEDLQLYKSLIVCGHGYAAGRQKITNLEKLLDWLGLDNSPTHRKAWGGALKNLVNDYRDQGLNYKFTGETKASGVSDWSYLAGDGSFNVKLEAGILKKL